ncbi:MAG: sensor histidine kinase, partial [Alphaproteobacteria bacterium]
YLSLHWLFVRPMRAITASMVSFRDNPEDGTRVMIPSGRRDEIGVAQHELADMQVGLRAALQQKARLAALGTAVTQISHDLRNILATAKLVSDRVGASDDPEVKRNAPTLLDAIDRAVRLCSQTLHFAQEQTPSPQLSAFLLYGLVDEVAGEAGGLQTRPVVCDNRVDSGFTLSADREQLFRVLSNLVRNAYEAGADNVAVQAAREGASAVIEVSDDGPGLPAKVCDNLFQPFTLSGKGGGSGLGLSIARDLIRGHGGDIELARTGPEGTVFRLFLPLEQARESAGAALAGAA